MDTNDAISKKSGNSKTILLVEDNDMVLNVAMHLLDDLGYKIIIAHNVDEAMDAYQQNRERIDLVMSDVVMPLSSGPEMYSRMHAIDPDLPALFVTGYDINQSMETLEKLGCEEHCAVLQKPYSQSALSEKLQMLLNRAIA